MNLRNTMPVGSDPPSFLEGLAPSFAMTYVVINRSRVVLRTSPVWEELPRPLAIGNSSWTARCRAVASESSKHKNHLGVEAGPPCPISTSIAMRHASIPSTDHAPRASKTVIPRPATQRIIICEEKGWWRGGNPLWCDGSSRWMDISFNPPR
jgi:hypothetical protein